MQNFLANQANLVQTSSQLGDDGDIFVCAGITQFEQYVSPQGILLITIIA